jgi:importin subunit beta-1
MQIVCEATQSDNIDVQVAAFECLCKIVSLYYEKMDMYMAKALYGVHSVIEAYFRLHF